MADCLYRLPAPLLFLNAMDSTVKTIRGLVGSNLSNTQLGAAIRAMFAPPDDKKKGKFAKSTKPDLTSQEQFLEKFPDGDVSGAVVGNFFNIKGRPLPHGLEWYYPKPPNPHKNIRVIRVIPAKGGSAAYVPPGGNVDYSDTKGHATPDAPGAPKKKSSTKSLTNSGAADGVKKELFAGHKKE